MEDGRTIFFFFVLVAASNYERCRIGFDGEVHHCRGANVSFPLRSLNDSFHSRNDDIDDSRVNIDITM